DRQARQSRPAGVARQGQGDGAPVHRAHARRIRHIRVLAMIPFELLEPTSLHEALGLLDPNDPTVRPIAGGTALMLMMKAGVFRPTRLGSLRKVGDQLTRVAGGAHGPLSYVGVAPRAGV